MVNYYHPSRAQLALSDIDMMIGASGFNRDGRRRDERSQK
jgi:hypothetical protein